MPPLTRGDLIAVTGSNGFIGSHIVNRLLQDGYHVRAVVRDPTDESKVAHLQALPGASERLQCVGGSLLEAGGYDDAFANVAAIIHTAAVVEVIDNSDPENRIVRLPPSRAQRMSSRRRKRRAPARHDLVCGGHPIAARPSRRLPIR